MSSADDCSFPRGREATGRRPASRVPRGLPIARTTGQHQRLGDAVFAAQKAYADSGTLPEILGIYHLFGDPAMRIR
jgi:hypothetical protein